MSKSGPSALTRVKVNAPDVEEDVVALCSDARLPVGESVPALRLC